MFLSGALLAHAPCGTAPNALVEVSPTLVIGVCSDGAMRVVRTPTGSSAKRAALDALALLDTIWHWTVWQCPLLSSAFLCGPAGRCMVASSAVQQLSGAVPLVLLGTASVCLALFAVVPSSV